MVTDIEKNNFDFYLNRVKKEIEKKENKLLIVGNNLSDLHILPFVKLGKNNKPTSGEIRLAKEIFNIAYPLYKNADKETIADFIIDIFNYEVPRDRIIRVNSFKKILFKKIIIDFVPNGKSRYNIKTKKVRKKYKLKKIKYSYNLT